MNKTSTPRSEILLSPSSSSRSPARLVTPFANAFAPSSPTSLPCRFSFSSAVAPESPFFRIVKSSKRFVSCCKVRHQARGLVVDPTMHQRGVNQRRGRHFESAHDLHFQHSHLHIPHHEALASLRERDPVEALQSRHVVLEAAHALVDERRVSSREVAGEIEISEAGVLFERLNNL
eukprot:1378199-Rhodomonas_salina.1